VPKGAGPVVERQTKYVWDHLDGSLEVTQGHAHCVHLPTVHLDGDARHLVNLAASAPDAVHVVIRDNARFASLRSPLWGSLRLAVSLRSVHLRDGDTRLPARVRIVPLPSCSPELNPCEQAWDVIKDEISNHCYRTIDQLRDALLPSLKRFKENADRVISLIGRPCCGTSKRHAAMLNSN
jgi:transposase